MMMQQQKLSARASSSSRARAVAVTARATTKAAKPTTTMATADGGKKKGPSFLSQTISALDFVETSRSKKDADLLYDAKYGQRGADGKMTPEQYAALRRKVGGTAKGFFKEWVEEDVTPVAGFAAPGSSAQVPFLPLLVGVVVALIGVTVVVVEKTA